MKNLLQLTLVSTLLVACGGETAGTSDDSSNIDTAAVKEEKPIDACEILKTAIQTSYADASDLKKARDITAEMVGEDMQQYLPDDCGYRFTSQGASYDVYTDLWRVHSEYADDEAFKKKITYLNTGKTESIEGIGEQAVYAPELISIVAFNNSSIIQINAACVGEYLCEKGKTVAVSLTKSILIELDK